MENVERTQFVVLTGHLDEQPLPDLIRTLRVQRKSGRLQVEYPEGPGSFFFEEGQLVDAHLGTLRGVEALYAALALGGASFNFNPLVRPPERSIDRQGQKYIWDLIESPRREGLAEIKVAGGEQGSPRSVAHLQQNAPRQLPPAAELVAPLEERLTAVEEAIISTSHRFSRERLIYAVIIGFLAGLSLITTLNVIFGPARTRPAPAAGAALAGSVPGAANDNAAAAMRKPSVNNAEGDAAGASGVRGVSQATNANAGVEGQTEPTQAAAVPSTAALIGTRRDEGVTTTRREYVVQVLVEVKNGRVTDARVWNPRPGAGAYEAVALRMARERRYPESFNGGERLRISVKP
ncbi:MAG TPA: DUF4388 domain-containing protein [Pyrinomonadaceae bacterium]|nr:DUF4388 domain-containing protein [Pyrinomonadaceae bacterium]